MNLTKRSVRGKFVKLLSHTDDARNMHLIEFETRCVRRSELHEIVTTDRRGLGPGDVVDHIGFLGFAEFEVGGVVERGDVVAVDDQELGTVAGFDDSHFPNHYNVIIEAAEFSSAGDLGLSVGSSITFSAR